MSWVIQKMLLSAQNNWLYVCCDTVSVHVQVWSDNLEHYLLFTINPKQN